MIVTGYTPAHDAVQPAVLIVREAFTGTANVGCTFDEGKKLQVAPAGSPMQVNITVSANGPAAETANIVAFDGFGTFAVSVVVLSAPSVKSTTLSLTAVSCGGSDVLSVEWMLKLKGSAGAVGLEAVTLKFAVPPAVRTIGAGGVHTAGAPAPQLRVTVPA